jgi:hypothetical protein
MYGSRITGWTTLCVGLALAGCTPSTGTSGEAQSDLATINGLSIINGLSMTNGLSMVNGLSMTNGLAGDGLMSGSDAMNTDDARTTMAYLVRCALPPWATITKQDADGNSYTFYGAIGVAPQWQWGACDSECELQVTPCMLAHVNTSGVHIPLWVVGDNPLLGWGLSSGYPDEEGSFFGNIFVSPPKAFYCNGKDFDVGVVPGRLGAGLGNAPYTDPYGGTGYCRDNCTPADIPDQNAGYKACMGYNHVFTVWRNPDPSTITTTSTSSTTSSATFRHRY